MAIRNVRTDGDPILRKKSREVEAIDDKIKLLIGDMKETMKESDGVGLAAVQVGMLKRIIVVDPYADEDEEPIKLPFEYEGPFALINPEILETSGSEVVLKEGCLSVPNTEGYVKRPEKARIKALDENFEPLEFDADGYLARIIFHEVDHLNGILFTDKLVNVSKAEPKTKSNKSKKAKVRR